MIEWKCRHCNKTFLFTKPQQSGGHSRNCSFNPNLFFIKKIAKKNSFTKEAREKGTRNRAEKCRRNREKWQQIGCEKIKSGGTVICCRMHVILG